MEIWLELNERNEPMGLSAGENDSAENDSGESDSAGSERGRKQTLIASNPSTRNLHGKGEYW